MDELMTWSAASRSRMRPTPVDPVKDSLRSRGSRMMGSETAPLVEVVVVGPPRDLPEHDEREGLLRRVADE